MATHTLPTTEARGRPQAVMMAVDEYEGWLETLEIARSASWTAALAKARREDRAGRRLSYEAVVGRKTAARP